MGETDPRSIVVHWQNRVILEIHAATEEVHCRPDPRFRDHQADLDYYESVPDFRRWMIHPGFYWESTETDYWYAVHDANPDAESESTGGSLRGENENYSAPGSPS